MFAIVWLAINLQFCSASSTTHQFVQWSDDHSKNVEYKKIHALEISSLHTENVQNLIQFSSLSGLSGLSRIFFDV